MIKRLWAALRKLLDPDPGPHLFGAESMIAMSRALQRNREKHTVEHAKNAALVASDFYGIASAMQELRRLLDERDARLKRGR